VHRAVLTRPVGQPVALRRPELDWLRVAAVLVVFLAHVAQIFSPSEAWLIESPDRSRIAELFTVLVGPWIIPLFMLVAGASAWYSLQHRGVGAFFRARVLRLLVPLVAGTFLVIPPQMYFRSRARGTFEGSYIEFYPRFFDGVFPEGNFSYGHLWFLVYLLLVMTAALPFLDALRQPAGRAWLGRVADRCERGLGILWLAAPMAAAQIVLRVPFTATTGAVINDWATLAWFLLVFLAGFALMAEDRLMAALDRQWRRVTIPAVLSMAALVVWAWPGDLYARIPGDPSLGYVAWWILFNVASWACLVVILGAARRHLAHPSPALQRCSENAYAFYIFHQPVIVFVAFHLVAWPLTIPVRFAAIAMGALILTVLILEAVRRILPLRLVFGLPPRRSRLGGWSAPGREHAHRLPAVPGEGAAPGPVPGADPFHVPR
jgi:glucans biosynthesis protein C